MWYVYIVCCQKDNSLYTGATTDVARRIKEHNTSSRGAKYTKARRPVWLLKYFECKNKKEAFALESKIKKLSRSEKLKL